MIRASHVDVSVSPGAITPQRWSEAQRQEREYWCPSDPGTLAARRDEERARQQWYADLMGITRHEPAASYLDLGCGPESMLFAHAPTTARRVAVDPCDYGDREAYERAGIVRRYAPAEGLELDGRFEEVWCYNVLQHVVDPPAVIRTAQRYALTRVRIFEWVRTPVTTVHPHSVDPDWLCVQFADWRVTRWMEGRETGRDWSQDYVALVAERA